MDQARFVGPPVVVRNEYKYFKRFSFIKDRIYRLYAVGDYFLTKHNDEELIGEVRELIEKPDDAKLIRVSFYVFPEQSPEGRQPDIGEHEVFATQYDSLIPLNTISEVILQKIDLQRSMIGLAKKKPSKEPEEDVEGEFITGYIFNKGQTLPWKKIKVISYGQYYRHRTMLRRLDNDTRYWMDDEQVKALGLIPLVHQEIHMIFCRYYCSCTNLPYQNGKESLLSRCKDMYKKLKIFPFPVHSHMRIYNKRHHFSIKKRVDSTKTRAIPAEKEFEQQLKEFMKQRQTPISRVPNLGFKKIELFQFYNCVQLQGGYDQITSKRLWKNIYDAMGGDPGSTSAATCTRKHYERLLLPFERHLKGDDALPEDHNSIMLDVNVENVEVSESTTIISESKSENGEIVNEKIILQNKIEKNPSNEELSVLKNMLGFNDKVETGHHDVKKNESLKLKLEKLPKTEHGRSKEFWQKKAIVPNEVSITNSEPPKEDSWNEIRKKNALARSWARIQKTPKAIAEKQEMTPKPSEQLSYQSEAEKTVLFNLMKFNTTAHGDSEQRLNSISSSISPSERVNEMSTEIARTPIVPETITNPNTDVKKTQHSPIQNKKIKVDNETIGMQGYCPFRNPALNTTSLPSSEIANENTILSNLSDKQMLTKVSKERVNIASASNTNSKDSIFLKPDPNFPHLYTTHNNKTENKVRTQKPDSSEKNFAQNQNIPLFTSETVTRIKLSDTSLYQRPSVIIHTEQVCSPPPNPPPVASKVIDRGVADNSIISQALISQNQEQFITSLKFQQPQVENKIVTKQFYDPITKQLHDLPIIEPMAPKIKTSNTPSAKRKGNSKKSDSTFVRHDPVDKMRNTLWKNGNNAKKNVSSHPSSNKATKRKKTIASNQNLAKAAAVLSVPVVEEKKLKLPIPVIHSSPFISSLSKYASVSFKRAPRIYRDPESIGSNEPIDLSLRCIGKGRSRRLPSNGMSDTIGLDLSLRKINSSPHTSSTCGIENITPPPETALRDASLYSNGLDYIPSAVRKKIQQAFLETKALSIPHNKGPQSSTPASQMPSTSLNFISRNHPLYSVPISSNSARYPGHSNDNDPRFKPNAYMSPLWLPPSYETKANMPQLTSHVDTKPFSLNHLSHEFYPYINNERQCCNDELFSHRSK